MAPIAIWAGVGFVIGAGVSYARTGDVGKSFQAGFKGGVTGAVSAGFASAAAGGAAGVGGAAGAASTGILGSGIGWGDIGKMALLAVGSGLFDSGDAPTAQVQVPEYQPLNYPTPEPMRLLAETAPEPEPEPPPDPEPETTPDPEPEPPLLGVPISAQPGVFGPREPSAAEVVALNEARETREAAQRKQETEEELGGIRFLAARDVAIDPFARRRRPRTALERFSGAEPTLGAPYSTYA